MKSILAAIGSSIGILSFMAAIPVFINLLAAAVAGFGSLGFLAWRAYRRR